MTLTADDPLSRTAAQREESGRRLLKSSAALSYDPLVDLDWDAPLLDDAFFAPQHRITLYGTDLWDSMSRAQRIDLSRLELASIASMGIWFETLLMQMMVRRIYDDDPRTATVQYGFTEIGDECRHSVMFGKLLSKLDAPYYRPVRFMHEGGRFLKATSNGATCFAGALFVEEVLDQMQREARADESLQPLVRGVSHVHIVEEARHMRFARDEAAIEYAGQRRLTREWSKLVVAASAYLASRGLVHPHVYRDAGLDMRTAVRVARTNPHARATRAWAARRVRATLEEIDMITGPSRLLWKHAGLLEPVPAETA
ncbi:diiron oxygenase [Mumia zhuanghuii]|uniref:Diiron oxygenase n=2 Tax=Mumia TaxID=1546255 RepID=A0ABW1QNV5_9ACTN|nr:MULTISPECIES: diiron oxygenase [Mumia]KAA1425219.1 diiron oxygenase [Mumia zhuanghuii]